MRDFESFTFIRGATLNSWQCHALYRIRTYPRQLTYAHTLQYTQYRGIFDCTLNGPFADLQLTRLSPPRALCEVIIDVISASTVYYTKAYAVL